MLLEEMRALVRAEISRRTKNDANLANSLDYSDDELNILINQMVKEFCMEAPLSFDTEEITITDGLGTVTLDIKEINRVEIDDEPAYSVNPRVHEENMPL